MLFSVAFLAVWVHTIFPPGDEDDDDVDDGDDQGVDDDVYDDQSNVDDMAASVPGIFPPSLAPHCLTIMPIKSAHPMMMTMMMMIIIVS